jgi:type IV fimbrial biogenesis protein FimT
MATTLAVDNIKRVSALHVLERGFSLVELMVVLAILGLFAAVAVPSFQDTIRSSAVWNASSEFQRLISVARTEAIKRNVPVSVTPFTTCPDGAASTTNWGCGMQMFVDPNGNGVLEGGGSVVMGVNVPEQLLSRASAPASVLGTPVGGGVAAFTFGPSGNLAPGFGNRSITFCPKAQGAACACSAQRIAQVSVSGRVTVQKPTCP